MEKMKSNAMGKNHCTLHQVSFHCRFQFDCKYDKVLSGLLTERLIKKTVVNVSRHDKETLGLKMGYPCR